MTTYTKEHVQALLDAVSTDSDAYWPKEVVHGLACQLIAALETIERLTAERDAAYQKGASDFSAGLCAALQVQP